MTKMTTLRMTNGAAVSRPYIVSFPAYTSQVIVNHSDCRTATDWTREYFSLGSVSYVCSDLENNHTFECSVLAGVSRG